MFQLLVLESDFFSTMEFWSWDPTTQNVIVWLESLISDLKGCSENLPLYAWYLLILTPNVEAHISMAEFPDKIYIWIVIFIRCT